MESAIALYPVTEFDFTRDSTAHMTACSFAVIGSSKSGKTTFINYLLKSFKDDIKTLFTQSAHNAIYDAMKKDCCIAPDYIPEVIKSMYQINKHTGNKYKFLCIVDDLIGAKNDKEMTKLLCLYRNSGISAIIAGQDPFLINATGRANVNHQCLFYLNSDGRIEDTLKMFLRSYFPRSLTMDEKIGLYKELTKDHHFLWINNLENTIKRCKMTPAQIAASERL